MRKWLTAMAVQLMGAAALLLAVAGMGRLAMGHLRDRHRFVVPFAGIVCTPPPGQARAVFLGEVQYLAGWPDRLQLLDDDLPRQLAEAFGRHPWVKFVDRVEVAPVVVRVHLTYRIPVLAIPRAGADGPLRAVDEASVLLPLGALTAELPLLEGESPSSAGAAGLALGDPRVEAAARTAALLHPHREKLKIAHIAFRNEELVLISSLGSMYWGSPPGLERPEEPKASVKVEHLLAWAENPYGDCDLRK